MAGSSCVATSEFICIWSQFMRHSYGTLISLGILSAALLAHVQGCDPDCSENLTCGEPPTATGGGGGGDPASCVPKVVSEMSGTAVKDECGIFVRLAGDDTAI